MKAYIFPGQGSQYSGMGKELVEKSEQAKRLFEQANDTLHFDISKIMFSGTEDELKQTKVTQPAIFIHSVVTASLMNPSEQPDMVAGHSLGEFSALVANKTLSYEAALQLVFKRAMAMQKACEIEPSTMAAILNLEESVIEAICLEITNAGEIVVPANYNCPGQLVISGSIKGVQMACDKMKMAGAKRALILPVGGGFHSPFMEPAKTELAEAINTTHFNAPICPIYQNYTGTAVNDPILIKQNLISQLTAPVKWTQSIKQMIHDGATTFIEVGPGKVLQGLVKKVNNTVDATSAVI